MNSEYTGQKTDFYFLDPAQAQVADTINLAIALRRPILVEGEPGCGKTQLAYSIATELGLATPIKITVKSTSRAQDLLYRVDALRRLQDAQNPRNEHASFLYPYIKLGLFGQAIHKNDQQQVVLIDEIDKADIDFPNDLLDVLDRFSFQIDDLPLDEEEFCIKEKGFGREIRATDGKYPIVIITSNREKRLPEPFLRRCLYVRLKFPDTVEALRSIVQKNLHLALGADAIEHIQRNIADAAVQTFITVRQKARENGIQKPPSTGELIDWVNILYRKGKTADDLNQSPLLPPYWELLFKNMQDLDQYIQSTKA